MTDTPLPTQDILGVELVRAGGPFKGTGSAKGGDYITPEQLAAAAASSVELRDELRAPVKLGHNDSQQGLAEAGLFGTDGAPAAGWVDNLRVEGDRLLADLRAVPRVVADLVKAGAYRARSIEFWRGYTDASGKQHPMVITGLALLGAKLPAVRGLKDIVALYAGEVPPGVEQVTYTVTTGEDAPAETAEVSDGDADGTAAGPKDGPTEGTDAPLVQQEGDDREHKDAAPRNREDGGNMPDTITPELSTALGLSQEADMAAVEAKVTELSDAAKAAEELRVELGAARERIATLEQDDKGETRLAELAAEVEALRGLAQDGVDAAKELAALRKDRLFAEALESKRITPAQADKLREQYDAAPEAITSVIETLEPRTDLSSELEGEDGKGDEAAGADADAMYAQVWGETPRETITTPAVSGQEEG